MTDFIEKLAYTVDLKKIEKDLEFILENYSGWEPDGQISLRHRPNCANPWKDSSGGLPDREKESCFSEWNLHCPEYTKQVLEQLAISENIVWGRIRFMRANSKMGLSMHYDHQPRYHLVVKTNPSAIIAECFRHNPVRSIGYHLPANSHWYKVDTTREHFVYNGGWNERIHLVCCPIYP